MSMIRALPTETLRWPAPNMTTTVTTRSSIKPWRITRKASPTWCAISSWSIREKFHCRTTINTLPTPVPRQRRSRPADTRPRLLRRLSTSAERSCVSNRAGLPRTRAIHQANVESRRASADSAKAQLDAALLNLSYCHIVAPVDGIASQRSAEIGSRISQGQQLIVLVQTAGVWTTANFKETQLRKMHVGQRVNIKVDSLDESFEGEIENMPAATGDRSSLFPPENATGNFVKIVQRLPVRIRFNPNQRDLDKLRPGMSVEPKVHLD